MKKNLVLSLVTLFLLMFSASAHAALTTIGTAQIDGTGPDYNLIWDDDNNGNSLVWLDYTTTYDSWFGIDWIYQRDWAAGLRLTYNLNPAYTVTSWNDGSWRLPTASGGSGYDKINSEMGHLYYLENTQDFANLEETWYWSGTAENHYNAWIFDMDSGYQMSDSKAGGYPVLAVRSEEVSVVPVPGALWLLGSGLIGLLGIARMRDRV